MIRHWKKVKTLILKMIINLTKRIMVPRGSINSIARKIKETPLKNRIENCDRGMGTDQKISQIHEVRKKTKTAA